jgi:hypothetical protein
MLDANPAKITKAGRVVINPFGVIVEGFEAEGASCRDVAALAMAWAIGELQRELLAILERPEGTGRVGVD